MFLFNGICLRWTPRPYKKTDGFVKWTPKFGQKRIRLFGNEFGIQPGSFLLVWERFSRCSSSECTLSDSGQIRPLSETFRRKTSPPLTVRKSFPWHCCPGNCLFVTCFAEYYVLSAVFETLSFGIASLDRNARSVLRLSAACRIILSAFLSFAENQDLSK